MVGARKHDAMTARCSVFIATSLDGFISRSDGRIDWLIKANAAVPPGEDRGYAKFFLTVDALVMGRNTFEQALSFAEWPYGSTPVFVLSHSQQKLPTQAPATVSLSREAPSLLVQQLSAKGFRHLYIDGGLTIQSFLAAGLIGEMTITVIPVLLGSGKPLFGPVENDVHLELVSSTAYEFGFVQSTYRVATEI
jgi:dihydrofolate reductase